jgi:hypothetical protein
LVGAVGSRTHPGRVDPSLRDQSGSLHARTRNASNRSEAAAGGAGALPRHASSRVLRAWALRATDGQVRRPRTDDWREHRLGHRAARERSGGRESLARKSTASGNDAAAGIPAGRDRPCARTVRGPAGRGAGDGRLLRPLASSYSSIRARRSASFSRRSSSRSPRSKRASKPSTSGASSSGLNGFVM